MQYEFDEVLNDLIDYFLLGDLLLLQRFKQQHQLPDDLAGWRFDAAQNRHR